MSQSRRCNIPKKRKEKVSFWSPAVEAWEKSGLTQQEFCRDHGLRISTFRYWKKELSASGHIKIQQQELIPVAISVAGPSSEQAKPSALISLNARGRYRIDIHEGFHPETPEQVLEVLERVS